MVEMLFAFFFFWRFQGGIRAPSKLYRFKGSRRRLIDKIALSDKRFGLTPFFALHGKARKIRCRLTVHAASPLPFAYVNKAAPAPGEEEDEERGGGLIGNFEAYAQQHTADYFGAQQAALLSSLSGFAVGFVPPEIFHCAR